MNSNQVRLLLCSLFFKVKVYCTEHAYLVSSQFQSMYIPLGAGVHWKTSIDVNSDPLPSSSERKDFVQGHKVPKQWSASFIVQKTSFHEKET